MVSSYTGQVHVLAADSFLEKFVFTRLNKEYIYL
jgi:hypothetical protein